MIRILHEPEQVRAHCDELRRAGARVGLVPTMGALHAGHLSLVDAVRTAGADAVLLTLFVNPLQFGENEDLSRYPRTLDADIALLSSHEPACVFAPAPRAMYAPDFQTYVEVTGITAGLEGEHRPTHFRGVTTVVAKLFHIVGPCVAAFGRKDYQQWRVVCRMVEDLNLPVSVLGCPIVRECDGLALSSRNRYLAPDERIRARSLYAGLCAAQVAYTAGERSATALVAAARVPIEAAVDRIDYVALADPLSLAPIEGNCREAAVLLVAAHIGATRLIDNAVLGQDEMPYQ